MADKPIVDVAEQKRLNDAREAGIPWKKWGPYLSERQWGTVREDYSNDGNAWDYFSHDQSRSRAYHWGEDGLGGISDDKQRLCFAIALWNGRDPILKERLFGLTNSEGNHGEDVKEYYFYIDSTPTHSYMKYLYKYPQSEFPYRDLVETNAETFAQGFRVRAARHGRVRRPTATSTCSWSMRRRVRRTFSFASRLTIEGRRRPRFMCCRRCGSATPGRGATTIGSRRCTRLGRTPSKPRITSLGPTGCNAPVRPSCSLRRTRPTTSDCGASRTSPPT